MAEVTNDTSINAVRAVSTRFDFYLDLKKKLNEWLKENPTQVNLYLANKASIDIEYFKWEADLVAINRGEVLFTPPTSEEIEELREAVQNLSARVAAANAMDEIMAIAADAATQFRG